MGKIKVAFATGIHNEFGYKGMLPWQGHPHQDKDFTAFKEFTKGCVVVMGKHTFASLPFRLPTRINVVLGSENLVAKNGDVADVYFNKPKDLNLKQWLHSLSDWYKKDVVVIGGANLVNETLAFADGVLYTRFHYRKGYEHDVSMPLLPKYIGSPYRFEQYGENETFMDITYYKRG